jgi:hypothetical protein
MSKPTSKSTAIRYYANLTTLKRSLKRHGLIQIIKSVLWVTFHSEIEAILAWINHRYTLYTELPEDRLIPIDEAYYFVGTGMLWTSDLGFIQPNNNNNPHALGKFLFSVNALDVLKTVIFEELVEYDQVYIGDHPHGKVYGHFVQNILAPHLAITSQLHDPIKMLTTPEQTSFVNSYNQSVKKDHIDYRVVGEEICIVKNVAAFPLSEMRTQKKWLRTVDWQGDDGETFDHKGTLITRRRAFERRIHNRSDVVKLLEKHDIVPLHPEQNSMRENLLILSNSDIIVAPEGSGLIDCFFLSEPSVLMFTGLVHANTFQNVIELVGGTCQMLETPQRHTDFVVDLDKMDKIVAQMISC